MGGIMMFSLSHKTLERVTGAKLDDPSSHIVRIPALLSFDFSVAQSSHPAKAFKFVHGVFRECSTRIFTFHPSNKALAIRIGEISFKASLSPICRLQTKWKGKRQPFDPVQSQISNKALIFALHLCLTRPISVNKLNFRKSNFLYNTKEK